LDAELMRAFMVLVAVALVVAPGHARIGLQQPDAGSSAMTPEIVKRQLSNGLKVWIVEHHELPVVQMSLLVLAGTDADPPGQYGIASLMSAMLTEGAGSRSGAEIADALDTLVANLSASSSVDSSSLQLYVPVARIAEGLSLMADVAQRPTFPVRALDTMRQQRLATLRGARGDPDAIAALAFARGVYGLSHRSAAPLVGTAESLAALTPEALQAFHASTYRPDNGTLIVVGDVDPENMLSLLETHFGKWQPRGANGVVRRPDAAPRRPARQVLLVDVPGAPQSRVLIGGAGASDAMPDVFPTQILNAIVRGRLSADRNATLRDYTAGVRSGFDTRKSAPPLVVSAAAQADKTAESLRALVDELSVIVKGVPAEEIERAKADVATAVPKTFEATGRLSSRLQALESLVVYGLPDDYYARQAAAIQAVRPADVQRVAQQYLHPDHLTMVVVGDLKTIEAPIRAMKLGPIATVSIDDVVTPRGR
jgi:zinc protease